MQALEISLHFGKTKILEAHVTKCHASKEEAIQPFKTQRNVEISSLNRSEGSFRDIKDQN